MESTDQGKEDLWPTAVPPYAAAILFETFLYGVYFVLFGIWMFLLIRRGRTSQWALLVFMTLLFAIATADISYTFYLLFEKILGLGLTDRDVNPKFMLYVTTNFVADTLLIYRCYVIWHSNVYVIIGPAIVLVLETVCGYITEGTVLPLARYGWVYLIIILGLNVTITGLIVGKIWRAHRAVSLLLDKGVSQRYKIAIYASIESGAIYSLYLILDLSIGDPNTNLVLANGFVQIVGIMPTLIIVQSELTRSIGSTIFPSASDHENIQHRKGDGQPEIAPGAVREDGPTD